MRVANPLSVRTAAHPTLLDTNLPSKGALATEYLSKEFESEATNIPTTCATPWQLCPDRLQAVKRLLRKCQFQRCK